MANYRVKFLPSEIIYPAEDGESILELAMKAGIHINASCGGNGSCGKCRVRLIRGEITSPPHHLISESDYNDGIRLACLSAIHGDAIIEIPLESQIDSYALKIGRQTTLIITTSDISKLVAGLELDPPVIKRYVELPPPSIEDNVSDLTRLTRELKRRFNFERIICDFQVLPRLSHILRDAAWKVTVTMAVPNRVCTILRVEPGNREDKNYSIAIDIGTTTVCGHILHLAEPTMSTSTSKGIEDEIAKDVATLAEVSEYNRQISYGDDVISRITYSQKGQGLKRLQHAVVETINTVIKGLITVSGVDIKDVSSLAFAGNTVMSHLCLGLDPKYIMLAPYTPVATSFPAVRAVDLGIEINPYVYSYLFPCVSSYVGGDIVAGVLGSGMFKREEVCLFMDIGTNGEVVLGNKEWLMCASCSAGPAFEGGGIRFGMKAGDGAIEQVKINPETFEPMILTIGKQRPKGICGSGLIDLVAGLLYAGLIEQNGRFKRDGLTPRVRRGDDGYEYVICYADETSINKDIVITEVDIENLIRAKAALYAGCRVLLKNAGLTFDDVAKVIIAGGFGHYIDIEKAKWIGLLPELPAERFSFVGNGSLLGARLVSLCKGLLKAVRDISKSITNIELSDNSLFMEEYMAAMFLPHTDKSAFSGVFEGIRNRG